MAHNRDDSDYEGSYRSGENSSSRGVKTSDFNTTSIVQDGKLFGIQLPPEVAPQLNIGYGAFVDYFRKVVEKHAKPIANNLAKQFGHNEAAAELLAHKTTSALGYGVIFSQQIYDISSNVSDSAKQLNQLRVAVAPLQKSSPSAAPLSGSNEVVSAARKKITSVFWDRFIRTGTDAIKIIPALSNKISEQRLHDEKLKEKMAMEEAMNDPEKLVKITGAKGVVGEVGKTSEAFQRAMEIEIVNSRKAYDEKFKAFKTAEKAMIEKEYNYYVPNKNDSLSEIQFKAQRLQEIGIHVPTTDDAALQNIASRKNKNYTTNSQKSEDIWLEEFNRMNGRKANDDVKEKLVRLKYIQREGAFDGSDLELLRGKKGYNRHEPPVKTIRSKIEEKYDTLIKEHIAESVKKDKEKDEVLKTKDGKAFDIQTVFLATMAGVASNFMKGITGADAERYRKPIALDRILHLRRELENAGSEPPEKIAGMSYGKDGREHDKDMSYIQFVHEVFQQNQRDWNRPEVGARFFEHFEQMRWDDKRVNEMPYDKLTGYEYAVRKIAKRIKDGRLDPIALITLVGDPAKKLVSSDGRRFGLKSAGSDEQAIKDSIKKVIDEQSIAMQGSAKISDEQMNEKLADLVFSMDDAKRALASDAIDKTERAFIFAVLSDLIGSDEKLCGLLGMTPEQCRLCRSEVKESFAALMNSTILTLADTLENDPEKLDASLKFTDKEKEFIQELAQKIQKSGKDAAETIEGREQMKMLDTVVANAMVKAGENVQLEDEEGKKLSFWQRVVAQSRKARANPEKHMANDEAEAKHLSRKAGHRAEEAMEGEFTDRTAHEDRKRAMNAEFGEAGYEEPEHSKRVGKRHGNLNLEETYKKKPHKPRHESDVDFRHGGIT